MRMTEITIFFASFCGTICGAIAITIIDKYMW